MSADKLPCDCDDYSSRSQATQRPDIKLHINGRSTKTQKSARFLGVVFDQHLTWSEHIDYVTSKCSKRLNLMRAPLRLRRLQQQIKFAVKVKATSSHIAKNVFDDHWTTHYDRFSDNKKPLALKVNQFFLL